MLSTVIVHRTPFPPPRRRPLGADVGAKDHDEVTALMNAAESGSLEAVEALLRKGADAGSMSATAFTPLIVAAAGGHLDVVKVRKGVDVYRGPARRFVRYPLVR